MERMERFSEDYYRAVALACEARLFSPIPDNDAIDPPHVFSEGFNRRMDDILRLFGRRRWRISKRAKIVIVIAAALVTVLLTALSVGAVRDRLYRLFFLEKNSSYAVLQYQLTEEDQPAAPESLETLYRPSYIPEGYIRTEEVVWEDYHSIEYTRGAAQFEFNQTRIGSPVSVNMQDVEADTVKINGRDVLFLTGRTYLAAYWCNDEYRFTVIGVISREEAEKLIASVGRS